MASNYFNPINILNTSNSQGLGSGGSLNVGGGISIGGDTYIGGKVAISGTTTSFSDNILILNDNPSASSDTGILLQRFSQDVTNNNNYSGIIYSEIADEFRFGYATADTRGSLTLNSFVPIRTNGVTITGGGLNAIGNSNTVGSIFTTGGNVGINTTSPTYTLDVDGNMNFTGNLYQNGNLFAGSGSSQWITTSQDSLSYAYALRIDGTGEDFPQSIITDSLNNMYVTGHYNSSRANFYSKDGTILATLGNLNTNYGTYIAKYSSSGELNYISRIDGTNNEYAYSITTDGGNNVYVTGISGSTRANFYATNGSTVLATLGNLNTSNAGFVAKYNSFGALSYISRIDGTGNDYPFYITTDGEDNVYVTGYYNSGQVNFYATNGSTILATLGNLNTNNVGYVAKYNSFGALNYILRIDGNNGDFSQSVITDAANNVYITGYYNSTQANFYATNGSTVLATLGNLGGEAGFLAKYTTSGTLSYVLRIDGTSSDVPTSITTDSSSATYVTGYYNSTQANFYATDGNTVLATLGNLGNNAGFIAKYNSLGALSYVLRIDGIGNDLPQSITTDNTDAVYVTGNYNSTQANFYATDGSTVLATLGNLGTAGFIAKYSSLGALTYVLRMDGTNNEFPRTITTDSTNALYVTGRFLSSQISFYDIDGTVLATMGNFNGFSAGFVVKYNNIINSVFYSGGNVGIGTTNPISTLDVKGSFTISGNTGSVTLLPNTTNEESTYTLPSNIPTTANTYLTSNSNGNMSWKLPYQIGDIAPKQMDSTFVEMNGQVLSQSTYPELYAAIGHNPEIKFNIKNLTQTLNTSTSLASSTNVGRENIARNNNTIIVVGSNNAIFRSADNGVTWTHPVYYATLTTYTIIHYCAGTWNRWILGSSGAVLADSTDDGITWTLRSSANYQKFSFDFNPTNSIGIAVGSSGFIQRSTDGTTWATITALNVNNLRSIVYANISGTHTWVTVGDSSTIGYSTNDGATFTLATGITAGIQFNIVIWVGGSINLFIAGGGSNNLWTSPNGITWTSRSGVSGNVLDMVKDHTDSYIVAATSSGVARSTNGTTWTSTSLASTSSISYDSTNTTFLGVGTSRAWYAKVATFSTWTEYTTTFNRVYRASIPINGGGSILYTIDTGGIMNFNTSTNTESTVLSPVYSIKDIAYGNGIFVAISSDAFSSCFTSTDGDTWTYRRFNTAAAQNAFTGRRIKYLNGNFIILSTSTIIFTSTDSITWTQGTTPNTTKNDIIWTGTNYVACTSDNGQLIYSSNLSSWTAVSGFGSSVGTGIIIEDLTHLGNGTIIAVARFGCILKSTNHGVSWSLKRAPSISIYDFCSVAYSATDNELVAVTKTTNQIAYSIDQGDTWQTYQADTNYAAMQFNGVIQGNNDFIVYGRNSLMGFSSSGVTWEWTSPGGNFEIIDMIYADGVFLGAGLLNSTTLWSTPIVVYSTNGKNWTIKSVPHSLVDNALPKQRIGYGNKKFILSSYLNLVSTNVWVGELQYDPSTEFQLSTQYFGSGNTKMWIKASN